MRKLYVLYDSKCALCKRLRDWLLVQRCWLELHLIPLGSEEAKNMFPGLENIAAANDLAVISDEGHVYLNDRAWIMVLYALEEYRGWAFRLAHPLLMPLARQAFATISQNRYAISRWVGMDNSEQIAQELRSVALEPCAMPQGNISEYLR